MVGILSDIEDILNDDRMSDAEKVEELEAVMFQDDDSEDLQEGQDAND
jgi:hypothetical protein